MKTASMGEIKSQFSAFVKLSESAPVVVTRNGKPVAVLVGIEDNDEVERVLMANSPRLQAILAQSRTSIREGRGIPRDEFWNEFAHRGATKRGKRAKAMRRPTRP